MINPVNRYPQIFILLYSFIIFGAGIWGASVITMSDESDYIQSSEEMLNSGDLLSPTLRGELRFTKPPLLYWIVAASYKVLGISYFSSRLPMVIFGVLTILFVYRLGLLLFERNAAMLAALMTATSFGIIKFSKVAMMESPLTFTMVAAFYYFIRFYKEEQPKLLLVSALFLGLCSQLKSPVYPAICVMAMLLFLLSEGAIRRVFIKEAILAAGLLVLLTLPWYVIMILKHGSLFTDFYYHEHFVKFYEATDYRMRVFVGLLLYFLPWTFYLIGAVYQTIAARLYRTWPYKFLLITSGLFLAIFILPKSKGLYYAVPLLPFCGLLAAGVLAGSSRPQRLWDWLTAAVLLLIAFVIAVAVVALRSGTLSSITAIVLILAAARLTVSRHRKTWPAILFGLSAIPIYLDILPTVNLEVIPAQKTLAIVGDRPVYSYDLTPLRFSNALGRRVTEIRGVEKLKAALDNQGYVIIKQPLYDALDDKVKNGTDIYLQWPKWARKIPADKAIDAIAHRRLEQAQVMLFLIARRERQRETEAAQSLETCCPQAP
jgi:4-amino-4-deoxy-L-arabinose transferase-like glycosyltransferase